MNISSLEPLNNRYMHIAYVGIIASILLLAAIGPSLLTAASDDGDDVIVAHGTFDVDFGTCVPGVDVGCISLRSVDSGSKTFVIRDFFFTSTGDLVGHGNGLATVTVDGFIQTFSSYGSVTGSVAGREGTFAYVNSGLLDLSGLAPGGNGHVVFDGNFAIIEGTGTDGFEGVCGFGTFSVDDVPGTPLDYTTVFVFDADDCDGFDVGDFLDILADE